MALAYPSHLTCGPKSKQSLINGNFNLGADNLDGWTVSDSQWVAVNAIHRAVISESLTDTEVSFYQDFVIPNDATTIEFS